MQKKMFFALVHVLDSLVSLVTLQSSLGSSGTEQILVVCHTLNVALLISVLAGS